MLSSKEEIVKMSKEEIRDMRREMNSNSGNSEKEVSYSDNSHIFGIPFVVRESYDAYMTVNRRDIRDWVERVASLGIEFHFSYKGDKW